MGHFVQVKSCKKILLNPTFKMWFFKILNIKWKIIIMLIIIQKKDYFQYIKKNSWLHFFLKTRSHELSTLLCLHPRDFYPHLFPLTFFSQSCVCLQNCACCVLKCLCSSLDFGCFDHSFKKIKNLLSSHFLSFSFFFYFPSTSFLCASLVSLHCHLTFLIALPHYLALLLITST